VRDLSITLDLNTNPGELSKGTVLKAQNFPPRSPSLDAETVYVLAFFKDFLPRNNFTGRMSSPWLSIQGHLSSHKSLVSIVCAIGALQSAKIHRSTERHLVSDALRCYTTAITTLRNQIARTKNCDLLQLSWSTFLLGLFEVRFLTLIDGLWRKIADIRYSLCAMIRAKDGFGTCSMEQGESSRL
jgi:hypothetical protein